ncbi:hypothetical protein L195_g010768 [Trifolium pratense]|uniref:Uncharacterized protein n=1 Tax=Trifolium pratense TaxID=57577 RepID=A0A2K3PFT4_TRIPR|nr:hypothetical protein L195_g010768 [Trifolium pratense]
MGLKVVTVVPGKTDGMTRLKCSHGCVNAPHGRGSSSCIEEFTTSEKSVPRPYTVYDQLIALTVHLGMCAGVMLQPSRVINNWCEKGWLQRHIGTPITCF